jgi:hypothetical protein
MSVGYPVGRPGRSAPPIAFHRNQHETIHKERRGIFQRDEFSPGFPFVSRSVWKQPSSAQIQEAQNDFKTD